MAFRCGPFGTAAACRSSACCGVLLKAAFDGVVVPRLSRDWLGLSHVELVDVDATQANQELWLARESTDVVVLGPQCSCYCRAGNLGLHLPISECSAVLSNPNLNKRGRGTADRVDDINPALPRIRYIPKFR